MVSAILDTQAAYAIQYCYQRLVETSPVDTGLLQSQWRADRYGIRNRVPYIWATEDRNRSSRGYVLRAIHWSLQRAALPSPLVEVGRGQSAQIIRIVS